MQRIGMEKTKRDFHSTKYYVNALKKETIRTDHPLQRSSEQWSEEYRDGLIGSILKDEDIPYIVICEQILEDVVRNYLIDGIQRITTIYKYRHNAFKLGNKVENPLIEYEVIKTDENGRKMRDENGELIRETIVCDIRGKYYKNLPIELQEQFDDYQLMEVKHLNCYDERIGYEIRRYNHAKRMGVCQNGITYLDIGIADKIKNITKHIFFKDIGNFKKAEKKNDTYSRVVLESIMATYYIDYWKNSLKDICNYLNKNIQDSMLKEFGKELDSISEVISEEAAKMFNSKNSFLWFTTYHKFCELGLDTKKFIDFMEEFNKTLHSKEWNGNTFDEMNATSTKVKKNIIEKLQLIEDFMNEFLHINKEDLEEIDILDFVKENIDPQVLKDDVEFHHDNLEEWMVGVPLDSRLRDIRNEPSLIGISVYAFNHEETCDDETMIAWFESYAKNNKMYILNQKENYLFMMNDLQTYVSEKKGGTEV